MPDDYTPPFGVVRHTYATAMSTHAFFSKQYPDEYKASQGQFDRWLAEHDAEVLEAAAHRLGLLYAGTDGSTLEKAWIGGVQAAASTVRATASDLRYTSRQQRESVGPSNAE